MDIPYKSTNIWVSHIFHQAHIALHLALILVVLFAEFIVDDDGFFAVSDDSVGAFVDYFFSNYSSK